MRYWEFVLTESQARKDFIANKYKAVLDALASSNQATSIGISSTEQLIDWFYNLDPSSNKKYFSWIIDRVVSKTATETLSSIQGVKDLLTNFEAALRTQKQAGISVLNSNIGKYRSLAELDAAIQQVGSSKKAGDLAEYNQARSESTIIHEDPTWVVAIPQTQQAAMYWTRGTTLCTNWGDPKGLHPTRENQFDEYPGTYVIHNRRDPKQIISIHFESGQFMDWDNDEIPVHHWGSANPFISKVIDYQGRKLLADKNTSVYNLIEYSDFYIQGRWPEPDRARVEHKIATTANIRSIVKYATSCIQGRWPEPDRARVENMIIEHGRLDLMVRYATDCIKDRWHEVEPKIIEQGSVTDIVTYAAECVKDRWPEPDRARVEDKIVAIASNTPIYLVVMYAVRCVRDRWPEPDRARVENMIIENGNISGVVDYALHCIKDRWPEPDRARVENMIIRLRHAMFIVMYAKHCIKGRWPETEHIIFSYGDEYEQNEYRNLVQRSQGDGAQ